MELAGFFSVYQTAISNLDEGVRSSISLADLNSDGNLEMVIGNYRGGIEIFALGGSPLLGFRNQKINLCEVNVYPNPSSGVFVVENRTLNSSIAAYSIRDFLVRTVESKRDMNTNIITLYQINYHPGPYFLEVFLSNGKRHAEKLILQ